MRLLGLLLLVGCAAQASPSPSSPSPSSPSPSSSEVRSELRSPAAFSGIADAQARSRALFGEAARVLLHPRCINCHPDGNSPTQGEPATLHDPPVTRGPDSHGVVGLECTSCHQDHNLAQARVPGAPLWALAPSSMTWAGRSARMICEQLKDPARNGGRTLAQIVHHSTHDALVGWAWTPGAGRSPAPGTQAGFGALMAAWVASGAACPSEAP